MNYTNYDIWESVKKNVYEKTIKEIKQVIETCNGNVAEVLKFSLDTVCDVTHSVAGTFWYYDVNDTKCIVAKAVRGGADLSNIRLKLGEGIAGKVINEGEGYKCFDVQHDPNWSSKADSDTKFVTKTMICVPMTINGYTFGCIQLVNKTDDSFFDEDDYQIATELAANICGVIDEYKIFTEIKDYEDCAVFSIRINNYKEICQLIKPKASINLLNTYYKEVIPLIIENGGVVDSVFYDEIIGYWIDHGRDSKTIGDDSYKCVKALNKAFDNLIKLAYGYFKCNLDVSVGISYGPVYKQELGFKDIKLRTIVGPAIINAEELQAQADNGRFFVNRDYAEITGNECRIAKVKSNIGGLFKKNKDIDTGVYEIIL